MKTLRFPGSKILKNLFSLELVNNSATLFSATVLANIISLVGYILLTKIYSMDVLGEYFSVVAASSIIAVFIHFGFAQAVPLMDEKEVKIGVTMLSWVSLSLILLGFAAAAFSGYLFFVFIASGIISFVTLIEAVLIREGRFRSIAVLRIFSPLLGFSCAIFSGYFLISELNVLIGSYYFGMSTVVLALIRYAIWPKVLIANKGEMFELVSSYSKFPKFIGPGLVFHTAAYNIPSIIGLHYFGGGAVAAYNLAYKIVLAPMTILGQAIGQAYISKLSHAYRNKKSLVVSLKLDVTLFVIATVASGLIYLIFPWVARILFEDNHAEITAYAIALIPLVFSMLSIAPLGNLFQFTKNQKKILIIQLLTFLSSSLAFSIGVFYSDFLLGVIIFSFLTMIRYVWVYYEIMQVRKHEV